MPAKKWIICGECEFLEKCSAGKNKMKGVTPSSPVYNEIGCWEAEQYLQQRDGRQLRFF